MKHLKFIAFLLAILLIPASGSMAKKAKKSIYVIATDYVTADGQTDVADALQKMIDENPGRTIFFPDGVYMLSHSLDTPADPTKAVHLVLANYATLKATDNWKGGALVRLGARLPFNTTRVNGSNYGIEGGIFDGSKKADGISIDSGRETRVNHVSIKNTQVGVHVKKGANSGSADCDIVDVNIVGNDDPKSVGVLVEAYDNTFTNMRIANINIGVWCKAGGNSFQNVHPLTGMDYPNSIGFLVEQSNCWFNYCYSDHFGTAFKLKKNVVSHFNGCWAWWYSTDTPFQVAIDCDGQLHSHFYGLHIGYLGESPKYLLKAEPGGTGCIKNTSIPNIKYGEGDTSASYIK